jgi:hypothetical protein
VRILITILILSVLLHSCNNDCNGKTTISYSTIEGFGGTECGIDFSDKPPGINYVVVDQITMESLLSCDSLPQIDFNNYVLLLGSYESDIDLSFKSQAVIRDCETQMIIFKISYDSRGTDTSMLVDYHAIIPKAPEDYIIDFAIETWQLD